jgi:hypothetical protein
LRLKAISGKNQRGFSFVAPLGESPTGPVKLMIGSKVVLTRIRESPRVPQDLIIIDKRLYKSLGAGAGDEVEVQPVDFEIPNCNHITLVVSVKTDVDARDVVNALSDRIEDMETHLDGLILMESQVLHLDSLGISVTINDVTPKSEELSAAQVDWRKVLKVYLETDLGSKCFNVCLVTDIGAASRKSDITDSSDSNIQRIEAASKLIQSLVETLSFCNGVSFMSSVVYSEVVDTYGSSQLEEGIDRKVVRIKSRSDAQDHDAWLLELHDEHSKNASGPSIGLSRGIELAKLLWSTNNKPTALVFLSSGTYSHGRNPVATVKKGLKDTEGISLFCVGLGNKCEETRLSAIAEVVNGTVAVIRNVQDIQDVKEMIINQVGKDV